MSIRVKEDEGRVGTYFTILRYVFLRVMLEGDGCGFGRVVLRIKVRDG